MSNICFLTAWNPAAAKVAGAKVTNNCIDQGSISSAVMEGTRQDQPGKYTLTSFFEIKKNIALNLILLIQEN